MMLLFLFLMMLLMIFIMMFLALQVLFLIMLLVMVARLLLLSQFQNFLIHIVITYMNISFDLRILFLTHGVLQLQNHVLHLLRMRAFLILQKVLTILQLYLLNNILLMMVLSMCLLLMLLLGLGLLRLGGLLSS